MLKNFIVYSMLTKRTVIYPRQTAAGGEDQRFKYQVHQPTRKHIFFWKKKYLTNKRILYGYLDYT